MNRYSVRIRNMALYRSEVACWYCDPLSTWIGWERRLQPAEPTSTRLFYSCVKSCGLLFCSNYPSWHMTKSETLAIGKVSFTVSTTSLYCSRQCLKRGVTKVPKSASRLNPSFTLVPTNLARLQKLWYYMWPTSLYSRYVDFCTQSTCLQHREASSPVSNDNSFRRTVAYDVHGCIAVVIQSVTPSKRHSCKTNAGGSRIAEYPYSI